MSHFKEPLVKALAISDQTISTEPLQFAERNPEVTPILKVTLALDLKVMARAG